MTPIVTTAIKRGESASDCPGGNLSPLHGFDLGSPVESDFRPDRAKMGRDRALEETPRQSGWKAKVLPVSAVAVASALSVLAGSPMAAAEDGGRLHLALNIGGQFDGLVETGFNLADVGSVGGLDQLPEGMRGVLWIGNGYNQECSWRLSDDEVREIVTQAREHPKFSGIYFISDEPHPAVCADAPEQLAMRSALVRSLDPNGRTFAIVQNGSKGEGEFEMMRDSVDLVGVNPYPCNFKNAESGCDLEALKRRIDTALGAGIEVERIVPVFQTFGQECAAVEMPHYRMPTVDEARAMLKLWDELVPRDGRPFDVAYSWGKQSRTACPTLSVANGDEYPDLLALYAEYFQVTQRTSLRKSGSD